MMLSVVSDRFSLPAASMRFRTGRRTKPPSVFTIPSQTMGCMQFVCTVYAVCMQFGPEVGSIGKSKAETTFRMVVCSVCSCFRSSSFFWLFPFKGSAYTAYRRMQNRSETRLNPTPDWFFALPPRLARRLHTSRVAEQTREHAQKPGLVGSAPAETVRDAYAHHARGHETANA